MMRRWLLLSFAGVVFGKGSKTCANINVGAKPCSGSGTYKSLIDFAGSASGQSTASSDLATKMTDYSVTEIDWAKAIAKGSCKAMPTCNGSGRTDGVKGRKDLSAKVRSRCDILISSADLRSIWIKVRCDLVRLEPLLAHDHAKEALQIRLFLLLSGRTFDLTP